MFHVCLIQFLLVFLIEIFSFYSSYLCFLNETPKPIPVKPG